MRLFILLLITVLLAGCLSECGDGICGIDEDIETCAEDCSVTTPTPDPVTPAAPEPTLPSPGCAVDSKVCNDGTVILREGPNCVFKMCPVPEPVTPEPGPVTPDPITPELTPSLQLESYTGEVFSLQKPVGWNVYRAGDCETFSIIVRDPANAANTIFYFNELGPMYANAQQIPVDDAYMAIGGYPVQWRDAPVLNPNTPEKFLEIYPVMAQMQLSKSFTGAWPVLDNSQVVSSRAEAATLPDLNAKTLRALFSAGSEVGEGVFYVGVMNLLPCEGAPASCISYAFSFTGITAEKDAFQYYEPFLTQSLQSLVVSDAYLAECVEGQKAQLEGALEVGKIMSQTSDVIMDSWETRQQSDDILSEKWSDGMFDRERVYNPDTGDVFEVDNGFFDDYDLHRGEYDMSDLQQLPADDHGLWTAAPLNGHQNIH